MGWVHCFLVSSSYSAQNSAVFCLVSPDRKGWLGDHQTSVVKPAPRGPIASRQAGKSNALATVAIFGTNFFSPACFQNDANTGGGRLPVRISTLASLNIWIKLEKSCIVRSNL